MRFNNQWMSLYIQNNGVLKKVEKIVYGAPADDSTGLERVGEFIEGCHCWARKGAPELGTKTLPSLSTEESPFMDFYIRSGNEYFQVAGVFILANDVHPFIDRRIEDDCGLIATCCSGFNFVASYQAVKPI